MLTKTFTIPVAATESEWVETATLLGTTKEADMLTVSRLIAPDVLTAITSISFESKYTSGGTAKTVKDIYGSTATFTVSANADVTIPLATLSSLPPYIRLKANAAASGAERVFTLGFRQVT